MLLGSRPFTLDRVVRLALGAALAFAAIWLLGYLRAALIPFVVAALIAYLMNPLVELVQKKVRYRVIAVIVSLLAVIVVLGTVGAVAGYLIMREVAHMGEVLSGMVNDPEVIRRGSEMLPSGVWEAVRDFAQTAEVQEFFRSDAFRSGAGELARMTLPQVWSFITGVVGSVLGFFFLTLVGVGAVVLYLFFILLEYDKLRDSWRELIPAQYRQAAVHFVENFRLAMARYFRAQAAVAAIVGVLFAAGFAIMGLPMGVLLGLFIGLLNMVPYLQFIGVVPAAILGVFHMLETGQSWWIIAIGITAVFVVVQSIQDYILTPKIMGKTMGLSPAMILLSIAVWGRLLGMLGLLIAIPVTCLLLAYYRSFLAKMEGDTPLEELSPT